MYTRRGYILDGCGLYAHGKPARPGEMVMVDDDLLVYFTKRLQVSPSLNPSPQSGEGLEDGGRGAFQRRRALKRSGYKAKKVGAG